MCVSAGTHAGKAQFRSASAGTRVGSPADLAALVREQRGDVAGVEPEQVAAQAHFKRAHSQPALEAELERAVDQAPDEPGGESVAGAHAVHRIDAVAGALDRALLADRHRAFGAEGQHPRLDAELRAQVRRGLLASALHAEEIARVL